MFCGSGTSLTPAARNRLLEQLQALDFAQLDALVATRRQEGSRPIRCACSNARAGQCLRNRSSGCRRRPTSGTAGSRPEQPGTNCCGPAKSGRSWSPADRGRGSASTNPRACSRSAPFSHAPLFQILAEQVLARSRRGGAPIPYFIMTSDATHDETVAFFNEHEHFGLPPATSISSSRATCPPSMRRPENCSFRAIRRSAPAPTGTAECSRRWPRQDCSTK